MELFGAIDIGGTGIKYAVVNEEYTIVKKWSVPTNPFDTISEFTDYLIENSKELNELQNIGISAPGVIDEDGNFLICHGGNASILHQHNLIEELKKKWDKHITVINDGKAAGICEATRGKGKNYSKVVTYVIGTGIGGSIILNQCVYSGRNGFAGEFSYFPMFTSKGVEQVGNHTSMSALIRDVKSKTGNDYDGLTIFKLYDKNEIIQDICNEWFQKISYHLCGITACLNPDIILLGGAVSSSSLLINKVRESFTEACGLFLQDEHCITTKIDVCEYHNNANLLGAVIVNRQN